MDDELDCYTSLLFLFIILLAEPPLHRLPYEVKRGAFIGSLILGLFRLWIYIKRLS